MTKSRRPCRFTETTLDTPNLNTELNETAALPIEFVGAMNEEARRVETKILAPRGLERRRVLILGGAGYIGSPLTRHLLDAGYAVRNLDLLLYGNHATVYPFLGEPNYEFRFGDHCDAATVEAALEDVTDVIILSGLVGDPVTRKYPAESRAINHDGIQNLFGLLNGRGLNKVVFVSTCSNYGLIPEGAIAAEDYELKPLSDYATAKVAAEELLLGAKGSVDYRPTVLRFATAFGLSHRMRFDLTVSEFTRHLFLGEALLVYDAETWRPYCHVRDFGRAIRRVLEAPAERTSFQVFNAGGDVNNFTKQMIIDEIREFLPDSKVSYQEKGNDPRNYRVDFSKIRETLHFEPRLTVRDGIAELIGALSQNLFAGVDANPNFFGNYELKYSAP